MKQSPKNEPSLTEKCGPADPKPRGWMADTNDLDPAAAPFGAGILPAETASSNDSGSLGEGIIFTAAETLDFADGADSYQ